MIVIIKKNMFNVRKINMLFIPNQSNGKKLFFLYTKIKKKVWRHAIIIKHSSIRISLFYYISTNCLQNFQWQSDFMQYGKQGSEFETVGEVRNKSVFKTKKETHERELYLSSNSSSDLNLMIKGCTILRSILFIFGNLYLNSLMYMVWMVE